MAFETPKLGTRHLYDYLGVASRALDDHSGETTMPIGDHARVGGLLRAAPLGMAFEHGVATYVYRRVMAVPIQIDLRIRGNGADVNSIRSMTRIVRAGRTLIVTEGEILDAGSADRVLAFGTIIWSVTGEAPAASETEPRELPVDKGIGQARDVDVMEAIGAHPLEDGSGMQVDGVSPEIAGPGGILHAGVLQLLSEDAALQVATQKLGIAQAVDCTFNFLQPARVGPFVAGASIMHSDHAGADLKVLVRDEGSDGRVCALSLVRVEGA